VGSPFASLRISPPVGGTVSRVMPAAVSARSFAHDAKPCRLRRIDRVVGDARAQETLVGIAVGPCALVPAVTEDPLALGGLGGARDDAFDRFDLGLDAGEIHAIERLPELGDMRVRIDKPGRRTPPLRSMTRVSGPLRASAAESEPTKTMRPSRTTTAEAS
jgi:hypothetical protein